MVGWKCPNVQIDYVTGLCNGCGISGCKECNDTLPICAVCDETLNLFLDASGNCIPCNIAGCTTCINFTDCSLCDS